MYTSDEQPSPCSALLHKKQEASHMKQIELVFAEPLNQIKGFVRTDMKLLLVLALVVACATAVAEFHTFHNRCMYELLPRAGLGHLGLLGKHSVAPPGSLLKYRALYVRGGKKLS
jgi:hypothetical protein